MHVVISPPDRRVCFGRLRWAGTCDVRAQRCEKKTEDRIGLEEVFVNDVGVMPRGHHVLIKALPSSRPALEA